MSTLKVSTLQNASSATANITLDTAGNATVGGTLAMGSSFLRNRIINGDMRIDQRNAGAALTINSGGDFYPVDRFYATGEATDGVFTVQQSTTAPDNFVNSLLATVTTADSSIGATQRYFISQNVEGLNVSDFGFGKSWARTVTLSFWVRSSVTGTFGGCLYGASGGRFYPFPYTINLANTWEQKTITVAGDTTGSWLTNNGTGIAVLFSLGCGSSRKGTANTWSSSLFFAPTGSVDLISTNGATFYITGVQLEVGSVATPFERRQYGQELALCQRYLPAFNATGSGQQSIGPATNWSTTAGLASFPFLVQPRVAPTGVTITSTFQIIIPGVGTYTVTPSFGYSSLIAGNLTLAGTGLGTGTGVFVSNSATSQILFSGCEL